MAYAKRNGFLHPQFFIDDGISGTTFERADFKRMQFMIENGEVSTVIVKDLSRFGRNYLQVGEYLEIKYPTMGVRFIAIQENVDTAKESGTEMMPFSNIFNEWYAAQTSKKIRAVNQMKAAKGQRVSSSVPYGYMKNPDDPTRWLVDAEAAIVVKYIFKMAMEGRGPSQIATQLTKDKVLTPTAYKQKQGLNTPQATPDNPSKWHQTTVRKILERREYTGCIVNFKTFTNSIWDKKKRDNPVENHSVFYDTHEAIIPEDIFEKVQVLRQNRQRRSKTGKTSLFSGMVYCADCGEKLYYGATNNGKTEGAFFDCSLHWKRKDKCGTHFIRESVLNRMVLRQIPLHPCSRFGGYGLDAHGNCHQLYSPL